MGRTRNGAGGVDGGSPPDGVATVNGCPRRPLGRPRVVPGPCSSLSVYLPTSVYDHLTRRAERRGQSVSGYVRDVLVELFYR